MTNESTDRINSLSRRHFVKLAGATAAASHFATTLAQGQKAKLTAGEVVTRIKANLGTWNDKTFRDSFKIGGSDSPVNGIATSFGGNFRVMDLANKAGLNMMIVHEPTFYGDADIIDWVKDDPMYKLKLDFARKHNLVVWRIHDAAHSHKPDFLATGYNKALGWVPYQVDGSLRRWNLPPTTLGELAKYVAKTLNTRSVRVIGDPSLPVSHVAGGGHSLAQCTTALQLPVDCILVSEAREYDSFEYVRDTVYTNPKKGAIFISHAAGEDEGMREFASWVTPLVPELPVKFIPTTDEYWTV